MKLNFVFTNYEKNWIEKIENKITHELFLKYWNEENDGLNYKINLLNNHEYYNISIQENLDYVEKKYKKYLDEIRINLNKYNGTSYEIREFEKAVGLNLKRFITLAHDAYKKSEIFFDENLHVSRIINDKSLYTPNNFQELRDFYQDTAYGQEQLFAIYIKLFTKNFETARDDSFNWPKYNSSNSIWKKILRIFTIEGLSRIIELSIGCYFKIKIPKIIVYESYFSNLNRLKILLLTFGSIQFESSPISTIKTNYTDNEKRKKIFNDFSVNEKFDLYFRELLIVSFPKNYVELNKQFEILLEKFASKYKNSNYIINESWIGSGISSAAVARAEKYGLKHIYNEHNFPCHFFYGNYNEFLIKNVYRFVSLGWEDKKFKNVIKGSSLRKWKVRRRRPQFNILYVSGPPVINTPDYSGSYGGFGLRNAKSKIEFTVEFFKNLDKSILKKIHYRG